jgi:hypothetical protein
VRRLARRVRWRSVEATVGAEKGMGGTEPSGLRSGVWIACKRAPSSAGTRSMRAATSWPACMGRQVPQRNGWSSQPMHRWDRNWSGWSPHEPLEGWMPSSDSTNPHGADASVTRKWWPGRRDAFSRWFFKQAAHRTPSGCFPASLGICQSPFVSS